MKALRAKSSTLMNMGRSITPSEKSGILSKLPLLEYPERADKTRKRKPHDRDNRIKSKSEETAERAKNTVAAYRYGLVSAIVGAIVSSTA